MFTDNQDSHALSMACVAAVYLGCEVQLAADLNNAGWNVTPDELHTRGEYFAEAWRVGDDAKPRCHLCCEKLPYVGALCTCLQEALPRRFVNLQDQNLLRRLAPETPAYTTLCSSCGAFTGVTVGEVVKALRPDGFKPFRMCSPCHTEMHAGGKNRQGKQGKQSAKQQAQQLQQEAAASAPAPGQA